MRSILEVGLGGRLDAVNAVDADAALVTSIALDHCDWLGSDVESIGREKAGIFPRRAACRLRLAGNAGTRFEESANAVGAKLLQAGP